MKIALIGPPETGKSKLARALAKHYNWPVVDRYIQRTQKQSGLALGPWSSYSEHFMVAGVRLAAEASLPEETDNESITVGTIIDTITYAAVKSDVTLHAGPAGVQEMYDAANAAMKGLALIYRETWDYHLAFHLGYSEAQQREFSGTWKLALDQAYPHVVESFETPYVYGLQGDHAARLTIAKEVIDLARTSPTEEQEATTEATPAGFTPPDE